MNKYEKILKNGTKVLLEEKDNEVITYAIIKNYIGSGVNCNAYEVEYYSENSDGSLKEDNAILKEFYPDAIIKNYCFNSENQIIERKYKNNNYFGITISGHNERWLKSAQNSFEKFCKNTNEIKFLNHKLDDYIVDIKDQVLISDCNDNNNIFSGFYITNTDFCNSCNRIFNYEKINRDNLVNNLQFLLVLINAIGVFHEEGYIVPDLKPSNIIYKSDNITKLRLIDMDSIFKINNISDKSDFIPCSIGYAAPELVKQEIKEERNKVGKRTDVYSLGIILFEIVFGSYWYTYYDSQIKFGSDFRCPIDADDEEYIFSYDDLNEIFLNLDLAIGTKNKLKKIWRKSICEDIENRYSSTKEMALDIQILIEIIQNKGVHPEVMLDKAIKIAEDIMLEDIDKKLFTDIKEVKD